MSSEQTIINANKTEPILRNLFKYKELIYFFTWRELKVRYKQATLGIMWVVLQPVLLMLMVDFIIVQRIGIRFGDETIPSFLLIFLGFIFWQLFEPAIGHTTNSFMNNQALFQKIYFPRMIPAISFIFSKFIDFFIGFVLLVVTAALIGHPMSVGAMVLMIPALVIMLLAAYGLGLFLGAINMKYRDIEQLVPFFLRLLFFATPVIWPIAIIPQSWQTYFYFNPAASAIEIIRQGWTGIGGLGLNIIIPPLITMVFFLTIGIIAYKRREKDMVDLA